MFDHRYCVFFSLLFVAGCGSSESDSAGGSALDSVGDSGEVAGATWTLSTLTTLYTDGAIAEGVQVCVYESANCATVDGDGVAVLSDLPMDENVWVSWTAADAEDDLFPNVTGFHSSDGDMSWEQTLIRASIRDLLFTLMGKSYDSGTGMIGFSVSREGVTAALEPTAGDGPYYVAGGLPSTTATETDETGNAFWLDVPPGEYDLSYTALDGKASCAAEVGTATGTGAASRVFMLAGFQTTASGLCN